MTLDFAARFSGWLVATMAIVMAACSPMPAERDEVARQASPDNATDAVLLEINAGATTDFVYKVHLVARDDAPSGQPVARLIGATRNEQAYGLDLSWPRSDQLRIEYFQARSVQALAERVQVAGATVEIELASAVRNPDAAPGGMANRARR